MHGDRFIVRLFWISFRKFQLLFQAKFDETHRPDEWTLTTSGNNWCHHILCFVRSKIKWFSKRSIFNYHFCNPPKKTKHFYLMQYPSLLIWGNTWRITHFVNHSALRIRVQPSKISYKKTNERLDWKHVSGVSPKIVERRSTNPWVSFEIPESKPF